MASDSATLVIGCGYTLLKGLQGNLPDDSVLIIEEPELLEKGKGGLREKGTKLPIVSQVIPGEYVHGCAGGSANGAVPRALVNSLPPGTTVGAVIPSTDEISAIAAAAVAAELGLPGATVQAAAIFRDKLELRRTATAAGLANPRWFEIHDPAELEGRVRELDSDGIVLKPAHRSGSQGVLMLDRGDDLAAAWRQTSTAGGRMRLDKPPPSRYLIEERMYGPECSVECLVVAGEVAFTNITAKRVLPGRYPVEIGHTLPAPLDTATEKELRTCMQTLVDATGYRYGILHGEWILKPEGPALVECAARIPGDEITNLLSLAYDVPFIGRYAALLAGDCDPPTGGMPGSAVQHSAITFFTPDPGTVQEITGVEEAAAAPGVRDVQVETTVGAEIRPMRTSGDRVGHIIAVGRDAEEATRRVEYAADLIRIVTDET